MRLLLIRPFSMPHWTRGSSLLAALQGQISAQLWLSGLVTTLIFEEDRSRDSSSKFLQLFIRKRIRKSEEYAKIFGGFGSPRIRRYKAELLSLSMENTPIISPAMLRTFPRKYPTSSSSNLSHSRLVISRVDRCFAHRPRILRLAQLESQRTCPRIFPNRRV